MTPLLIFKNFPYKLSIEISLAPTPPFFTNSRYFGCVSPLHNEIQISMEQWRAEEEYSKTATKYELVTFYQLFFESKQTQLYKICNLENLWLWSQKFYSYSTVQVEVKMAFKYIFCRPNFGTVSHFRRFCSTKAENSIILETDPENGITTVTLNRPPVNSLGFKFMQEIIETVDKLVCLYSFIVCLLSS